MAGRILTIGDIHGCLAAFDTLIEAVELGSEDTGITLGDYLDRGPNSRGVVDRLIALAERCPRAFFLGFLVSEWVEHDAAAERPRERRPVDFKRCSRVSQILGMA